LISFPSFSRSKPFFPTRRRGKPINVRQKWSAAGMGADFIAKIAKRVFSSPIVVMDLQSEGVYLQKIETNLISFHRWSDQVTWRMKKSRINSNLYVANKKTIIFVLFIVE
jgi:hypothetical protein